MSHSGNEIYRRSEATFATEERQNNERLWDELAEFMLNNQFGLFRTATASQTDISTLTSTNPGTKNTRRVYDSTALQAVSDLAAAFQGTLTNSSTVWSKMRYQSDQLNDDDEAVTWLEEVNKVMHNEFNESNFDTEIAKSYQSLVAFSNMALFQEVKEDDGTGQFPGFRFTSLHMAKIAWTQNKDGIVDTLYRRITFTARQAVERFGNNVTEDIVKALDEDAEKSFEFIHAIFPRDKEDIRLNEVGLAPEEHRPFASVYVDLLTQQIVEEGGFYEFPVYAARWGTMPAENYGRGPSLLALPDVRTLNRLKLRGLEAIDLQVRPPIFANQRDVFGTLDMRPGQVSVVKNHQGIREFVSQARSDILQFSVEELRTSIRSIFFLDKIQPLSNLQKKERMTELEVVKRLEEMSVVLGPTLARLNFELLQPLVLRSFKSLLRDGALPPVPEILKELGIDIEVVFVNQLARSQQIQDVSNIQQWVANLGALAQLDPSVIDNINVDGIARHTAKVLGVPEVAVQNQDVVDQTREARQQQAQQEQALQSANLAADTSAKLGGEDVE